jgi:hypothetical protein
MFYSTELERVALTIVLEMAEPPRLGAVAENKHHSTLKIFQLLTCISAHFLLLIFSLSRGERSKLCL